MKAYLNKPELKKKLLAEVKNHEEMDAIIQETYGREQNGQWKGCAVGCSLKSLNIINKKEGLTSQHQRYEDELGIPKVLAKLEDRIFEGLSVVESRKWPRQFLSAIPVGSDLSGVWDKFALWLLSDKKDGVIKFAKKEQTQKAIQNVIDLFKKKISGIKIQKEQWTAADAADAADAAYAAAASASSSAAYAYTYAAATDAAAATAAATAAYAAYAAAAAAYAATAADATAAYAAYDAAADAAAAAAADAAAAAAYAATDAYAATASASSSAARKNHYKKMAKKLLQFLKEAL